MDNTTELLPSFGRRRGRKLSNLQVDKLENNLTRLQISATEGTILPSTIFGKDYKQLYFEIGFGNGEHLYQYALNNPDIGYIGCEPFMNGVASLVKAISLNNIKNIRIWPDDARKLLALLPDQSLDKIMILFPDPWPKAKHHKRRLINRTFLNLAACKLKNNASLLFATDHQEYAEWSLEHFINHPSFNLNATNAQNWQLPPVDWIPTRYQQKAAALNHPALFFTFNKTI